MFVAGYNMPGYLPEMEPMECETFEDAKECVIDALKQAEDAYGAEGDEDAAETFCHMAEDVNLESRPFTTPCMPDGYVYWVDQLDS